MASKRKRRRPKAENAEYLPYDTLLIQATRCPNDLGPWKASFRLPDGFQGFVEEVALHAFVLDGWRGVWSEAYLWSTLMAVLFWDVIFAPGPAAEALGARHPVGNPFPSRDMPNDLHGPDFYPRRESLIANRMNELRKLDLSDAVANGFRQHYRQPCRPIWNWDQIPVEILREVAVAAPIDGLLAVLDRLLRHYGEHRRGVPDLFLWNDRGTAFAEVKGPHDRLSEVQVAWLAFLRGLGFSTYVVTIAAQEQT